MSRKDHSPIYYSTILLLYNNTEKVYCVQLTLFGRLSPQAPAHRRMSLSFLTFQRQE